MFNESINNSFTLSFDSWFTDWKNVDTGLEFQLDIGSAQSINSPKDLLLFQQTVGGIRVPEKVNNLAIFDKLVDRKTFWEVDGVRYSKDGVNNNYGENDYLDKYRDIKLIHMDYFVEEILTPFITYPDMKKFHHIKVTDLRFQTDHYFTPKKIQLFEECRAHPGNTRIFAIIIRHREIKKLSDGYKFTEIHVIWD